MFDTFSPDSLSLWLDCLWFLVTWLPLFLVRIIMLGSFWLQLLKDSRCEVAGVLLLLLLLCRLKKPSPHSICSCCNTEAELQVETQPSQLLFWTKCSNCWKIHSISLSTWGWMVYVDLIRVTDKPNQLAEGWDPFLNLWVKVMSYLCVLPSSFSHCWCFSWVMMVVFFMQELFEVLIQSALQGGDCSINQLTPNCKVIALGSWL